MTTIYCECSRCDSTDISLGAAADGFLFECKSCNLNDRLKLSGEGLTDIWILCSNCGSDADILFDDYTVGRDTVSIILECRNCGGDDVWRG